jgi:hypothetical protein
VILDEETHKEQGSRHGPPASLSTIASHINIEEARDTRGMDSGTEEGKQPIQAACSVTFQRASMKRANQGGLKWEKGTQARKLPGETRAYQKRYITASIFRTDGGRLLSMPETVTPPTQCAPSMCRGSPPATPFVAARRWRRRHEEQLYLWHTLAPALDWVIGWKHHLTCICANSRITV